MIDLNQPMTVSDPLVIPPENGMGYRVVIDLFPAAQPKFDQVSGWPADLKAREAAAERLASLPPAQTPRAASARKVIVIDPGHGGIDSGTSGVNGLLESELVLDEGLRLAKTLRRNPNYTVYMTRDSDVFIPLRERVNIGRSHHADLFVSLHADSNPDASVTGCPSTRFRNPARTGKRPRWRARKTSPTSSPASISAARIPPWRRSAWTSNSATR